jgi:virginiamycin A acetyltransferase
MIISLNMGAPFENKPRQIFFKNNPIVTLGNGSYIGGAAMDSHRSSGHILIGNYTSIAYNIDFVIGRDHEMNGLTTYPLSQLDMGGGDEELGEKYCSDYKKIKYGSNKDLLIIGHDVWIGRNCMIMGGVSIGNGSIIGAGSVVAKDIPPYCVAVENPIRIIKKRFSDEVIDKLEK